MDGPPFKRILQQRLVQLQNVQRTDCLWTANGLPNAPVSFEYTSDVFTEQRADGPPRVRGRPAVIKKKIYQRQFQWKVKSGIIKADGPPGGRGRSAPAQNGGTGHPWTYMPKSLSLSTKLTTNIQKLSLPLSQARGGDIKVKDVCRDSRTV